MPYRFIAKLVPDAQKRPGGEPGTWYITHGLGTPAAGTFTEVAFLTDGLPGADHLHPLELEEIVREVAGQLYGSRWAFVYTPDHYDDAIGKYGLRRRERVVVTDIMEAF